MAGRGPAPGASPARKAAGQRRRRNAEPAVDELPAAGFAGEFPELPVSYRRDGEDVEFGADAREWYETWARSPMAVEFTGVHWQRLQRVARLVDQFDRQPSKELAAELRLQEAGFGGTPMDLRRLGKRIARVDEPAAAPRQGDADVRRLRAVDSVA